MYDLEETKMASSVGIAFMDWKIIRGAFTLSALTGEMKIKKIVREKRIARKKIKKEKVFKNMDEFLCILVITQISI